MPLAGLKKQLNRANQYVSEKMGAAEGTKFTEEYHEMEKRTNATIDLVDELLVKTKEYLQPNPGSRSKMTISTKAQQTKGRPYNQPEGVLGESMVKYGRKLGEESNLAQSLIEMGEALKQMAEVKFALEDNVKQNFLEPLFQLQSKDIKDVMHQKKKLESRRLDFDGKKRKKKGGHVLDEEIRLAEEKFEESFNLVSMGMHNLLQNDPEHVSQLVALSEALYEYHSQCASILENLTSKLMEQKKEAAEQPIKTYVPKKLDELQIPISNQDDISPGEGTGQFNGSNNHFYIKPNTTTACLINVSSSTPTETSNKPSSLFPGTQNNHGMLSQTPNARTPVTRGPCCQALYDFDAENPNELAFKEGDIIQLNQKLDENWFQGCINGRSGIFPISYVQVLVPIGQQ